MGNNPSIRHTKKGSEELEIGPERIAIFTGHFGSGKTETAINYSIASARAGKKTIIVDLDIVNPYFRSTDKKDVLNNAGIEVISPNFAGTGLDVPSLPARIYSVFQNKEYRVVFDVGGDDIGAVALGSFNPYFKQEDYRMYYVINVHRPLSGNKKDIIEMLRSIENHSRLGVTHLINNSNLSYETTFYDIIKGQPMVEEVSKECNIPIAYISGMPEVIGNLPPDLKAKAFPINIFLHPIWDQ